MEFSSSLTILSDETPFLLEKRISLLEAIQDAGSISKAAKMVPLSYKAAWDAIDSINNLCPFPVVTKETGGAGGGGAKLTPYGKNLIQTYKILKKEHQKFLSTLSKMTDFDTGSLKSLQRIGMKLSARNQITGKIEHIQQGAVNASVFVRLKSGYTLVSVITNEAVIALELKEDDEVNAIFKSSTVLLTTDIALNISARNKFVGKIDTMTLGQVNAEITVDIGNGDKIASVITVDAVKSLGFKEGDEICAIIKASDIMIGK